MSKLGNAKVNGNGHMPQVSPVDAFPAPLEGAITVKLDTGRVIEMVMGELSMLYEMGEIPDELTPIALKQLFPPSKEDEREREKRFWERFKLAKWLAARVVVSPQMDVARFYHDEIWQIYNLANSPAAALDNFRRQQALHVATLYQVQDARPTAEPVT